MAAAVNGEQGVPASAPGGKSRALVVPVTLYVLSYPHRAAGWCFWRLCCCSGCSWRAVSAP